MKKVLSSRFFERNTLVVARDLLGKFLCRKVGGRAVAFMITETEGYHGFKDLASKARRGKTPGNAPMYARAGTVYVYFTYGMHWMLNIVTEKEEYPAAVLIRGAGGVVGPARLTKFLKIDKRLNTKMLSKKSGLWIEDRRVRVRPAEITKGPRVGIDYAGPYKLKPWRFIYTAAMPARQRASHRR
ncbi:MAG: DNA-3-methyladenine glycosylase [Patescibacteria group bacterium]|nr:DNA-3-methyladenine glycosylase [Patescibacteria group bacterium]